MYNIKPELLEARAADLPGMTGVRVPELFPDSPRPLAADSKEAVRKQIRDLTTRQIEEIDLSKIQAGDSVNILASHHGFSIYGGEAYAEMIRTIRDEVERRCRTTDIRLFAGVGLRFRETDEYIERFGLKEYFGGKAAGISPVDEGVPIQTEIGTLYGIKRAYNAKWIIHAHNNDIRELHYHRLIGRIFKPFAMSYATIETRSAYHQSMGPRAANFLPRAIYESRFVQEKFVCSFILQIAPTGIIGVNANNDLAKQDLALARLSLNWYGKLITLLGSIKECILVIDYPGPIPYTTAGGILFGNFLNANVDEFNLDIPFTAFTRYTDMLYTGKAVLSNKTPPPNPAIKALIINYCSKGYPSTFFAQQIPTMVIGAQADLLGTCEQNTTFMNYAIRINKLQKALQFAMQFSKTSHVLAFDGAVGGFNASQPLADALYELAPSISREVDETLMPLWCKQRGIVSLPVDPVVSMGQL